MTFRGLSDQISHYSAFSQRIETRLALSHLGLMVLSPSGVLDYERRVGSTLEPR